MKRRTGNVEYAENIIQLSSNLIALLLCLFHYVSDKRRGWLYAIFFFVCSLLSNYFWTAFLIITGDWPNGLDWLTYSGTNAAFFVLFLLLMSIKSPEERRFFHPLMLIPIPLNIWQFTLYLPYGNTLNNIYQVGIGTLLAVFSIQGICWYFRNRRSGARRPYGCLAILFFITTEFGMWTSSCMYEPIASFYYVFSFLCSADYLFLVWAIARTYADEGKASSTTFDRKYQRILKLSYLGLMLVGSFGGVMLGIWMRNILTEHIDPASGANAYDVIPVVLYVISLILVVFTVAVILIVYFGQKAAENNELREATRIAEHSSAAKSEFLASMSHEIRTPINAVMGMNEIILRESTEAIEYPPRDSERVRGIFTDIKGYAEVISNAGKNLLAIINDILDISRIEAGKMEIRESEYRLSSVLHDVCSLVRFRAEARNLSFLVNVSGQIPDHLFGDGLRIRQIMLNILNNAVKYTLHGSVTLSVTCDAEGTPSAGDTVRLVFSVRDTGIGIRREDLEKLFDKFERIAAEENRHVEGSGLGLAITKSLLDMMGGDIGVESVYGEGSVFTFTIPQKVFSPEPIGDYRDSSDNGTESTKLPRELFRAPDARVLLVDDTRMNLTVAEGLMKNTGIRIDTALSGAEALDLTLSVPYDLILMDQRMPQMDGTEALHLIREQENGVNRRTPVICLTADAIAGARERYLSEGFTDYLSKPINSRALRICLMRYLPREKMLPVTEPVPEQAAPETLTQLLPAEIDTAQGLAFCQQDEMLYRTILWEYASGATETASRLQQDYETEAWQDHAIQIHALKSTSATIGAAALSETAARLEQAARQENAEAVRQEHADMLGQYKHITETILSVCKPDEISPAENDGVFEFEPGKGEQGIK